MQIQAILLFVVFGYSHSQLLNLSCNEIRTFVNGHNNRRASLAKGQVARQPGANNMKYMVWDEELAAKAAGWASKYRRNHNPDKTLRSKRFQTGENLYWMATTASNHRFNVDSALAAWFDEHKDYSFGPFQSQRANSPKIGHYTQMAWADTTHVGCAVSRWRDGRYKRYFVVCNYGPPGNYLGRQPYQASKGGSGKLVCSVGGDKCKRPFGNKCRN